MPFCQIKTKEEEENEPPFAHYVVQIICLRYCFKCWINSFHLGIVSTMGMDSVNQVQKKNHDTYFFVIYRECAHFLSNTIKCWFDMISVDELCSFLHNRSSTLHYHQWNQFECHFYWLKSNSIKFEQESKKVYHIGMPLVWLKIDWISKDVSQFNSIQFNRIPILFRFTASIFAGVTICWHNGNK